jgi:hypothetical protein
MRLQCLGGKKLECKKVKFCLFSSWRIHRLVLYVLRLVLSIYVDLEDGLDFLRLVYKAFFLKKRVYDENCFRTDDFVFIESKIWKTKPPELRL